VEFIILAEASSLGHFILQQPHANLTGAINMITPRKK
jgi:hypothetical protein